MRAQRTAARERKDMKADRDDHSTASFHRPEPDDVAGRIATQSGTDAEVVDSDQLKEVIKPPKPGRTSAINTFTPGLRDYEPMAGSCRQVSEPDARQRPAS